MKQDQFLAVMDRDEADRRFRAVVNPRSLPPETVPLDRALHRVLAADVQAPIDVPSFDRSNVDGFAVQAESTFGASEETPVRLDLNDELLAPGMRPTAVVRAGQATSIATGGMLPRGADAVVMVEDTEREAGKVLINRPAVPGGNISFAGTDISSGETVLHCGTFLTSRETGVLAALGLADVSVVRRPQVAILSTGDELVLPGLPLNPGQVHDSNGVILADAVRELGGEPVFLGIVPDDESRLTGAIQKALACDAVLISGGTSKGPGDLSYRALADLGPPGIVAHGVALKPGKPLCLAAVWVGEPPVRKTVPIAVLPGFPTSAIFTFHEFVAPVLRIMAGRRPDAADSIPARLPFRVNSEKGRTEYLLVNLVPVENGRHIAFPAGKGSGSVTSFSCADGFVVIPRQREYVEAGEEVIVRALGHGLAPADFIVIGSHCVGLHYLLGRLRERGFTSKFLAVGSLGGLRAARRNECDLAGIHLLDAESNTYNRPFVGEELAWVRGYGRLQGIVFRPGDRRFCEGGIEDALASGLRDPDCILVNRNRGSGTRILIDGLLQGARPSGYLNEVRSHNAVAAAVAQGRADWGVAIENVATPLGLGFIPLREEEFDFVIPRSRLERAAVRCFLELLAEPSVRHSLTQSGFRLQASDQAAPAASNVSVVLPKVER